MTTSAEPERKVFCHIEPQFKKIARRIILDTDNFLQYYVSILHFGPVANSHLKEPKYELMSTTSLAGGVMRFFASFY